MITLAKYMNKILTDFNWRISASDLTIMTFIIIYNIFELHVWVLKMIIYIHNTFVFYKHA